MEAYYHVYDRDEKRALAQALTDVMCCRPRFDYSADYFVRSYRLECNILRKQAALIKSILDNHVSAACLPKNVDSEIQGKKSKTFVTQGILNESEVTPTIIVTCESLSVDVTTLLALMLNFVVVTQPLAKTSA